MKPSPRQLFILLVNLLLSVSVFIPNINASAQGTITFGEPLATSNFPDALTFEITASSANSTITRARLFYRMRNDVSETWVRVDVEPGQSVDLDYTWDTSGSTIPPNAPIFYRWEVTDAQGKRAESQEALFYYTDTRFTWQQLEDEELSIWWHDRPAAFGDEVYTIATQAFSRQKQLFGTAPAYPIQVLIYNNEVEFAAWHSYVSEFIGGQAFPRLGVTTQIVPAADPASMSRWLQDVIPHEISHLYFYQVATHPQNITPAWLDEGVAQYNEFNGHESGLALARQAMQDGNYIPLTALTGSFGYNEDKVRLAYAESVSAVTFLVEAYGADGLAQLLAAYRQGDPDQEAFEKALGLDLNDFEQAFLLWMGIEPGTYGTPTPTVQLDWSRPTATQDAPTSTPTPSATISPTRTQTIQQSVETTPQPAAATQPIPFCFTAGFPLAVFLGLRRRRVLRH